MPSFRLAAAVSAAIVLLAGLLGYFAMRAQHSTALWVSHTHDVIEQIDRAGALLTSAETAQRGYLLGGDARQLALYHRHAGQVQATVTHIAELTRDNPTQQRRIGSLRQAVARRLARMDEVLALWAAGQRADARAAVGSRAVGPDDPVGSQLQAMRDEEARLLAERLTAAERAGRWSVAATLGTIVLVLGLLYTLYALSAAHAQRLDAEQAELRRSRAETRASAEALREANDELQHAAGELEHRVAQRTRALAEANVELEGFARTVAHDLRAPLRNIQGYASALAEDEADRMSEDGREYTRRLVASVERLDGLITDLLAYSRLARSDLQVEPVALAEVVDGALQDLEQDLRDSGAQVEVWRPLPNVLAHAATLRQVVGNLLSNSLKFVEPGHAPRVRVAAWREGGEVLVCVADEGIGIDPAHHARIFDVFERLHGQERYPGTGIGLAIVRKGVERMGGRIAVDSAPGKGARFTIRLPAADA